MDLAFGEIPLHVQGQRKSRKRQRFEKIPASCHCFVPLFLPILSRGWFKY
jgi:hypothetical protein